MAKRGSEEWRKNISRQTRKAMREPELVAYLSNLRKGKTPWNKGLRKEK